MVEKGKTDIIWVPLSQWSSAVYQADSVADSHLRLQLPLLSVLGNVSLLALFQETINVLKEKRDYQDS